MKCIIIDDEQHAINLLENFIAQFPNLELIRSTTNPIEAISFLQQDQPDIVFLDINMPHISGIEFLNLVKDMEVFPNFILTTAYPEYALQGYEYQVIDYLIKPIALERFTKAIQKVQITINKHKSQKKEPEDYFFAKIDTKNKAIKINIAEILYVEGLKNYVSIFTKDGRIMVLLPMHELEKRLEGHAFIRIHRSYIIPINKIRIVEGNRIFLTNIAEPIPLGESYKTKFADFLLKNSLK
ncbi:MAG TPA: LytTR family DNA-binding domain-containing protein [Mucilaginibacter sp.]|nr:LytTR family DNA-binding domain-containing protein [Mucilaginibacter sp.]